MTEQMLASQELYASQTHEGLTQYLSFRYYRQNLDHLKDRTKDSINNFLKTISEIEDEFATILQTQHANNSLLSEYSFENSIAYMEENY